LEVQDSRHFQKLFASEKKTKKEKHPFSFQVLEKHFLVEKDQISIQVRFGSNFCLSHLFYPLSLKNTFVTNKSYLNSNEVWLLFIIIYYYLLEHFETKQVLRSTILSSTIVSFFFDNARIGRF
jgi:hypothetical protein